MAHSTNTEVRPDDFDDYVSLHQQQIRSRLARHPDPRDPEYPLIDWDEEDFIEAEEAEEDTEDFNDEPVPYDENKEV